MPVASKVGSLGDYRGTMSSKWGVNHSIFVDFNEFRVPQLGYDCTIISLPENRKTLVSSACVPCPRSRMYGCAYRALAAHPRRYRCRLIAPGKLCRLSKSSSHDCGDRSNFLRCDMRRDDADVGKLVVRLCAGHSGMFPCFLGGMLARLVRSARSAFTTCTRVAAGSITPSSSPRSAARNGLATL